MLKYWGSGHRLIRYTGVEKADIFNGTLLIRFRLCYNLKPQTAKPISVVFCLVMLTVVPTKEARPLFTQHPVTISCILPRPVMPTVMRIVVPTVMPTKEARQGICTNPQHSDTYKCRCLLRRHDKTKQNASFRYCLCNAKAITPSTTTLLRKHHSHPSCHADGRRRGICTNPQHSDTRKCRCLLRRHDNTKQNASFRYCLYNVEAATLQPPFCPAKHHSPPPVIPPCHSTLSCPCHSPCHVDEGDKNRAGKNQPRTPNMPNTPAHTCMNRPH
jgi:hypothetical protein